MSACCDHHELAPVIQPHGSSPRFLHQHTGHLYLAHATRACPWLHTRKACLFLLCAHLLTVQQDRSHPTCVENIFQVEGIDAFNLVCDGPAF